jgi:hypothetical protein
MIKTILLTLTLIGSVAYSNPYGFTKEELKAYKDECKLEQKEELCECAYDTMQDFLIKHKIVKGQGTHVQMIALFEELHIKCSMYE